MSVGDLQVSGGRVLCIFENKRMELLVLLCGFSVSALMACVC
jgi:hypothetical protein